MTWEKVKTWGLAILGIAALFLLGQWARARGVIRDTREKLAVSEAKAKAAAEAAKRANDLARAKDAVDATLREHLAQIDAKARADLAAEEKRREEVQDATGDVDRLIELGKQARKDGRIK